MYYIDLDIICYNYGFNLKEVNEVIKRYDIRFGEIIKILKVNDMYEDSIIIVLGDYSSFDEEKIINLNILFKENGYI